MKNTVFFTHRKPRRVSNPVFFTNKNDQIIFIYRIYDNSLFQLGILKENETTVLNIPRDSYISVKQGNLIGEFLVPNETILETQLMQNHYYL